jgi:hypothetical protein
MMINICSWQSSDYSMNLTQSEFGTGTIIHVASLYRFETAINKSYQTSKHSIFQFNTKVQYTFLVGHEIQVCGPEFLDQLLKIRIFGQ